PALPTPELYTLSLHDALPISGKLAIKFDGGHHDQPGDDASGEEYAGNARADDVANSQVFGGDGRAKTRSGKPTRPALGLRGPRLNRVHHEGVNAAEPEAPENA